MNIKSLFKLIVSIVTIGYLILFVYLNWAEIPALIAKISFLEESRWAIAILVGCNLASWIIVSTQFYIPLRQQGANIGYIENIALFVAGVLLNYTPHKAGVLYRLHYLKKWYGVSYAKFLGLQMARIISTFCVAGAIGLIALCVKYISHGTYSLKMMVIVGLMFVIGILPFFLAVPKYFKNKGMMSRVILDLYHGIKDLKSDRKFALVFFALIMLQFIVLFIQYWVIFKISEFNPSFLTYLLLIPLIIMLSMVSITPGNLGLRELVTASVLSLTAGAFDSGMLVGIVDRGILLTSTIIFGLSSLFYLFIKRGFGAHN